MPDRKSYPQGVPCWIDTAQPDPGAAVEFYSGLFGWTLTDRLPPEVPGNYFIGELDGQVVAAVGSPEPWDERPVWNSYVAVDDADGTAERVRAAGGAVDAGPLDVGEAGRMVICRDPGGAGFRLWQPGRREGAELVNAPGSWNFSDLHTRDAEQAKAFYGAVFGWVTETFEIGESKATLWRLPGYGDFLQQRDPALRDRQAEDGAPPGFADAVAWLVDADDRVAAPFWSVTFAVDDTDSVVARAVELGATVVSPVTDLGIVRVATLRDPQGAEFIVSRYQPG